MAAEQEQLNNVQLMGYLQDDAELRFTENGGRIAQASLKCYNGKKQNGEKEKPQWWKLKAFGTAAEDLGTLKKGCKVQISRGTLAVDYWQSRDGGNRQTPYIKVWEFTSEESEQQPGSGYTDYSEDAF